MTNWMYDELKHCGVDQVDEGISIRREFHWSHSGLRARNS
jgi:hypothetical protein